MFKPQRKLARSIACSMACAALLALGTPAVSAGPVVTGTISGMTIDTIDASKQVKLTIVKKPVLANNGDQIGGVEGLTFTVRHLSGFDLTSSADWDRIKTLTDEEAESLPGTEYTAVTDAAGHAVFPNLPVGVYFVQEDPSPDKIAEYREAKPYVLILPIADSETKTWQYDVVVHPKNEAPGRVLPVPPAPPTGPSGSSVLIPFIPLIPLIVVGYEFGSSSEVPPAPPQVEPEPEIKKGIPKKGLAKTGPEVIGTSLGALALILAGLAFVIWANRRSRKSIVSGMSE